MKILFLEWNSFCSNYIKHDLKELGHELVIFDFPQSTEDTRQSEELAMRLATKIMESSADIVFSLNYFAVAAIAAKATNRKYISWTYDSPYIQLYSMTIEFPTNYAFIFDKAEYLNLKSKGVNTVYYLPMAGPADYYETLQITEEDHKKYDCDIAMIGSMYTEKKHNLYRHFDRIDEYTKGYLDAIMNAQKNIYGTSILEQSLTPEIIKNIQKSCPMKERGDGIEDIEWVFANYFLARHLTSIERTELIDALSKKTKVTLYTPEQTPMLSNVENRGSVEYFKESPKAIKCAKINLNISLRSIVSGMPLRAFDIMACKGFLLTNFQADFLDYFEADRDYVYFENKEDMVEKALYYLKHDDRRMEIAENGFKKVKGMHQYKDRIKEMLMVAGT